MLDENPLTDVAPAGRRGLLARHPWLAYILPLAVFLAVGSLEPRPPAAGAAWPALNGAAVEPGAPPTPNGPEPHGLSYGHYPWFYAVKLGLTVAALVYVWPVYRTYAGRPGWLAVAVGMAGAVAWILLARWRLEPRLLAAVGLDGLGGRAAFNPFAAWPEQPALAWGYLAVRFLGLAAIVPVVEEFFLRGFVMRWVQDPNWEGVPFPATSPQALAAGTFVPMLMHPGELLAAAVWFSGVTWLMLRRRTIWDCVAAHAVTNLLLGVWVLVSGDWFLI